VFDCIVATDVLEDAHSTVVVMFRMLPSLKLPVAINCCVEPLVIDGVDGVTAMEVRRREPELLWLDEQEMSESAEVAQASGNPQRARWRREIISMLPLVQFLP
jgi:hypothetical protein